MGVWCRFPVYLSTCIRLPVYLCVLVSCVSDRVTVCSSYMGGCECLCVNV